MNGIAELGHVLLHAQPLAFVPAALGVDGGCAAILSG